MTKRRNIAISLATAAVMAIGFGIVWGFPVVFLGISLTESRRPLVTTYQRLYVQNNGTPLIQNQTHDHKSHEWDARFEDLDGNSVKPPKEELPSAYLANINYKPSSTESPNKYWQNRVRVAEDLKKPQSFWYFIHDGEKNGTGYIVGYNWKTKSRIGFIGINGFQQDPIPSQYHFPVDHRLMWYYNSFWSLSESYNGDGFVKNYSAVSRDQKFESIIPRHHFFVTSGTTVFLVDLQKRTVEKFLETDSPIERFTLFAQAAEDPEDLSLIFGVRTRDEILVLNLQGEILRKHAVPSELKDEENLSWYELADGRAFAYSQNNFNRQAGTSDRDLFWISAEGDIEQTRSLVLHSSGLRYYQTADRFFFALTCPAPFLNALFSFTIEPDEMISSKQAKNYGEALPLALSRSAPALIGVSLFSLVLSVLCYKHQTAFAGMPRHRIIWTVFVFLFGLPGFAGYLLHRRWPIRKECPSCSVKAPRNDNHCHACKAHFPNPELTGTEIFA